MVQIRSPKDWQLPEREATPEGVFQNRRRFIKTLGVGSIAAAGLVYGLNTMADSSAKLRKQLSALPPLKAKRNDTWPVKRPITDEVVAAKYNNFYEFSTKKEDVWELIEKMKTRPWQVEVGGLVKKPTTFDIDDLLKLPLEERVYRFRCVEAWAMVVPWMGFTMKTLLDKVEPLSKAKYVRLTTLRDPSVMVRQSPKFSRWSREPWPYVEGLRLDEAMNELTLLSVGMYGHVMAKQHGAPIRLVVPWKYGYKSIKSIVKIELTDKQPTTFWNSIAPNEYGFLSNVNPRVPHPRWSQAHERVIGTGGRRPTLPYNGYAAQVAGMYPKA